jgi:hypothetical protein
MPAADQTETKPSALATPITPTGAQFAAYEALAQYFNARLFGGALPPVLLNFSRKGRRTRGFFAPHRWEQGEATTHEISLNPEHLRERSAIEGAATLVHELCHLWQAVFGRPSRAGYHNREWAEKMESVGLMPSATGQPGGKRTGQPMSHCIVSGGPFAQAFTALPAACRLHWVSHVAPGALGAPRPQKTPYVCPGCRARVWGKPGLALRCEPCNRRFAVVDR